jgi:hypothetical protein
MTDDQSQLESDAGAVDEPAGLAATEGGGDAGGIAPEKQVAPARAPEPVIPPPDPELLGVRQAVFDATAAWLAQAWEQPIVRALTSNADRALAVADRFPALRGELRALQDRAAPLVEEAIGPVLDRSGQTRDQLLISSVESAVAQLVGLIGFPLKEGGFDPLSAGLERIQDGYRSKSLGEHAPITDALVAYNARKAEIAVARAEQIERDLEATRLEVERLWQATAES